MTTNLHKSLESTLTATHVLSSQTKPIYLKLLEVKINNLVRNEVVDKFWSYLPEKFEKYQPDSYLPFMHAISFLKEACQKIEKTLSSTGQHDLKDRFIMTAKTEILSARPHYLNDYIEATYFRAFRVYLNLEKLKNANKSTQPMDCDDSIECDGVEDIDCDGDDDDYAEYDEYSGIRNTQANMDETNIDSICSGCSLSQLKCDCEAMYLNFCKMNANLRGLNLLDVLASETIFTVSKAFIERRVIAKGKSNYDCSYLDELTIWVQNVVKGWIIEIKSLSEAKPIDNIGQQLDQYLKNAYAEVRVAHMFEIIIEYPNSEAAIQDLKLCIEQSTSSSFRLSLIEHVKQSLVESLLHPGVNTYDILTAYISAIKALRALDPSGLILQLVTEPVRRYLKSRNDTVRCIVTALTDEDHNSELNREMIRSTQTNENGLNGKSGTIEMNLPNEGEKCTANNFEKWKPDPIKLSSSDDVMRTSRFSDIVSILVNIYETKDLFVEEYQKLLSQRLLNKYDECNLDTELRNLELLTLRFNDCELHRCEVMLKDVQTSKRVNKRILSGDIKDHKLTDFKDLDVLIVSSPFWPEKFGPIAAVSDEPPKIKFPSEIQSAIDTYTKAFEAIQASRTLHWRHHLGSVNLDITIGGKVQNFTVSPLHAALLYMFKTKKTWKLHEIIHETSLTAATIRSRLALWQRNGIIRDCGDDKFDLIID